LATPERAVLELLYDAQLKKMLAYVAIGITSFGAQLAILLQNGWVGSSVHWVIVVLSVMLCFAQMFEIVSIVAKFEELVRLEGILQISSLYPQLHMSRCARLLDWPFKRALLRDSALAVSPENFRTAALDIVAFGGVIASAVLLVGVLLVGGVFQAVEFMLFNPLDASSALVIITAVSTVALAIATFYQTWQARSTVSEMKAGRQAEYMPVFRCYLNMAQLTVVTLMVKNAGKGPALDVNLLIDFKKNGTVVESRPFKKKVLAPQEDVELVMPEMQFDKLPESLSRIEVNGILYDAFGTKSVIEESIDVKEFVDSVKKGKILYREKDASLKPTKLP
jgi:hypothetical protein